MNLKLALSQNRSIPGDLFANFKKISNFYEQAHSFYGDLDIVVFGELALCGYSPLDELNNPNFLDTQKKLISQLAEKTKLGADILLGDCRLVDGKYLYNSAYHLSKGQIKQVIDKRKLVDYDVFSETRYFVPGKKEQANIIDVKGTKLAILICEDMWYQDAINDLKEKHFEGVICLNASPYERQKYNTRLKVAHNAIEALGKPLFYINIVGAADDILFDGQSFVLNSIGDFVYQYELAHEELCAFNLTKYKVTPFGKPLILSACKPFNKNSEDTLDKATSSNSLVVKHANFTSKLPEEKLLEEQELYQMIQMGFSNFIYDNNFKGVIIGLSGGIDSTLAATIAADTLGANNVVGISMPSQFTSQLSLNIIDELVQKLGIVCHTIPITDIIKGYDNACQSLKNSFAEQDVAKENLQSRVRGNLLMFASNSLPGYVVLCNGNKSELATGYFTLYGDSCGAYNLLKDLYKTDVFNIAKWRNTNISQFSKIQDINLIPKSCISRPPSAELKPNQSDEEALMPYATLDKIMKYIIENNTSQQVLLSKFDEKYVKLALKLLKFSEYKRQQSPIGPKLTKKSFGKEWRYPITNGLKNYYDKNNH